MHSAGYEIAVRAFSIAGCTKLRIRHGPVMHPGLLKPGHKEQGKHPASHRQYRGNNYESPELPSEFFYILYPSCYRSVLPFKGRNAKRVYVYFFPLTALGLIAGDGMPVHQPQRANIAVIPGHL